MKILKIIAASSLVICCLSACGGGGGSDAPPVANKTVLAGIATKGPFLTGSIVNVFAVSNGVKGALIIQAKTSDDNGSYSADLGSYTGPVLAEVSGSYLDEATGRTVAVPETAPIRAALPQAQGSVSLPVTPLTELAVQKTGGSLTADAITAANALVSGIFKVDIIGTLPVAPTTAALAGASQAQKDYTLALAVVSQMASEASGTSDSDRLKGTLTALSQGISATGMSSTTSVAFQGALSSFVSNPNNRTGISDTSATGLVNAGTLSRSYTLTLQGNVSPAQAIQFDIDLPAGLTVNLNSLDSTLLPGSLIMGSALPDTLIAGHYSSGTLTVGIITVPGVSAGQFATLTCNIPAGSTAPPASAFVVKNLNVFDGNEKAMAGVSVTVN